MKKETSQNNTILPQKQGNLDSLCSIYSIVNSIQLMLGDFVDKQKLFVAITNFLGIKLIRIINTGMDSTMMYKTLKYCSKYLNRNYGVSMRIEKAFGDDTTLGSWWTDVGNHIDLHGVGSVIIGISGVHQHWTCIKSITPKTIVVHDSQELCRFYRSKVTLRKPTTKRQHVIVHEETFLLYLSK